MKATEPVSLELFPEPLVIIRADGTISDFNSSFASLAGKERAAMIDKEAGSIDILKLFLAKIMRALSTGAEDFDRIIFNNRHFEVMIIPHLSQDKFLFVRILIKDITSFIRLENALMKKNRELIIINTLSSAFISSENMDLVIEDLIDKVLLITDFHIGWLTMKDEEIFRLKTGRGISPELQKNIKTGALDSLCADVFKAGEILNFIKPSVIPGIPALRDEGIIFLVILPLISDKVPAGLLFLASRVVRDFDADTTAMLSLVGNHVSHIIDKIRLFQETKRLTITDSLTGLYNTRYFYKYLDQEIARAKRYGTTFSIMLFDIDNFKKLNDTHGHQAGDDVLQQLAKILRTISRETDILVRYGGEEFIIILTSTAEDEAVSLGNRIRNAVADYKFIISDDEAVNITLSGGIASYPLNALTARSLLNAADMAMYSAKAAGKNIITCYKGMVRETNISH